MTRKKRKRKEKRKLREPFLLNPSNSISNESTRIIWIIPQSDILGCDFNNIKEYLERFSQSQTLLLKIAWQIEFAIDGYNDDPRELFEIPEVRRWFLESMLLAHIPWFYLLRELEQFQILLLAFCDIQVTGWSITPSKATVFSQINNRSQILPWLEINHDNLVKFVQEKKLPLQIGLSTLNRAKEMIKLLDLPLTFSLLTMLKPRPELGEYLYEHPQLKQRLLNRTFSVIIDHFRLSRKLEGIEVAILMYFPLVSQTSQDIYSLVLRFPSETDVDFLIHVLNTSWLSFQIIGLGEYCQDQVIGRYRPLEVTWIVPESFFYRRDYFENY